MHVCWGNYEAPHVFDVPLEEILPRLYQMPGRRAGAVARQPAPRARAPLPDAATRCPTAGCSSPASIDPTTNYVEHPEVVADRLEIAARAIGDPHRLLAGTDCGFDTAAGLGTVAEEVVWEKLKALSAGAEIATRRLLG